VPSSLSKQLRRKPKQDRARVTFDILLEAAARVLGESGYAGTTTNRVAAVAGVSVGTLYEYFGNKNRLFEALVEREVGFIVHAISENEPSANRTIEEELRKLIFASMGAVRHGPELFRALEHVPDARLRKSLDRGRAQLIGHVEQMLKVHRKEIRVGDIARAAFVVVSAAEGVGINASNSQFDASLGEECVTMLQRYLTG